MNQRTTTVSGDYVQGSFGLLPLAGDRARAAIHFAHLLGSVSTAETLDLARWYLRAALSEFRSIFDLLNSDLRTLNLLSVWEHSPEKAELDADSTVSVMRKVRDFAIHSAVIRGVPKKFQVQSLGGDQSSSELHALVIEPLTLETPAVRREASHFSAESLATFNTQAASWPADLLLQIAVYRTSELIAAFLRSQRQDEA